jgi:hypothetical protein
MADIAVNTSRVRALQGANVLQKAAGGSGSLGDALNLATTGNVLQNNMAAGKAFGVAVSTSKKAATFASGDEVGVVVFGRITGYSGMTPGKLVYLSATAGRLADAGTVAIGYSITDTDIFVMPGVSNAAS